EMSSQNAAGVPYGQNLRQWRLEQFATINRRATWGAAIGLIVYGASFVADPRDWANLVAAGLVVILWALFWFSRQTTRRSGPERGIALFCYSIIGFFLAMFYVRRGASIGLDVVILMIPMALAAYLLDPKPAQRIAIVSALGIFHDVVVSIIFPIPASNFALLPELAFNVIILPLGLSALILLNFRAASRAGQAITRLEQQSTALEETVRRRTSQLTTAAEIGRAATSVFDLTELLSRTIELIRTRFGYYHASVFLLDETGLNAVVRESTGEAGRILKERRHSLAVGSQSIIGYVTAQRKARVALDVGQDAIYFKNPLLPETRSELAIPLVAGDRLLGALDVQSKEPNAFTAADVSVLQTLADQLAIAIRNAELFNSQDKLLKENERLLAESRQAIEELNALTGRLSREGWQ
ncbi:MAG: GAF domain-containing protein, partial [Chloroflexota bacterium]